MSSKKQAERYSLSEDNSAAVKDQGINFVRYEGITEDDIPQVTSFSDCSELRRYLTFLPDESRSIKQLSDWLVREQCISLQVPDQIESRSLYKPGDYQHTYDLLGRRKELLNLIIHNIARLHAAYRETLVSLYFEQRSMRETSQIMGKSLSTVKRYRDAGILDLFFRLKHHELAQCQKN